jgi:CubicO group peptidase (beta-lactamase class C family)
MVVLSVGGHVGIINARSSHVSTLNPLLEPIRKKYNLPAIAAAVILDGRIVAWDATGFRKAGSNVRVTREDKFHICSCTKAMTATLAAILVERGKLRWDMTLPEALPELAEEMHPDYRNVTLKHLLAHQAGFPKAHNPQGMSNLDVFRIPGSPRQQRMAYAKMMLKEPPQVKPGEKYIYSNIGYVIAGLICEQAMDTPWETLMREMVFKPLGMETADLGTMSSPNNMEQPWNHRIRNGEVCPVEAGTNDVLPPARAPAGAVNCSIKNWAKFIVAHLEAGKNEANLLKPETFQILHTPPFGGTYALGWRVTERKWGGGQVLTHTGNNGSFAVVWMAPKRNFAVLVASNQGNGKVANACDEAARALIKKFLLNKKGKKGR